MKKQLLFIGITCLVTTILFSNAYAQTDGLLAFNSPELKKDIGRAGYNADNDNTHRIPKTYVSSKVLCSFNKWFENISKVEWYTFGKDYLAIFSRSGRYCKAKFTAKGHLLYNINYGYEESLPHEVRMLIKSKYIDYTIGRVTEVDAYDDHAWVVNLQDDDNLVIARVIDEEVNELAHYKLTISKTNK